MSPKSKTPRWVVNRDKKGHKANGGAMYSANKMRQWYSSKRWRSVRLYYLQKNPLCVQCKAKGVINGAEVIDHILPIRQGGDMYNEMNLQSMCKVCHDKKSRSERDTIVYEKYNTTP